MKYPVVEIRWGDAWGAPGWKHARDIDNTPMKCVTVGYLIKQDKHGITTAASLDESSDPGMVSFRPHGMITSVKVLKKADKETPRGKDSPH